MKKIYIITLVSTVILLSCGLKSGYDLQLDANSPYITRIVPGNRSITVYFSAQNNEEGFAGYNVYFNNDQTEITKTQRELIVLSDTLQTPTISAQKSTTINEYSFTISDGTTLCQTYEQFTNENRQYQQADIQNGIVYFVWISAYNINGYENDYSSAYRVSAAPRPENNNITLNTDESFSFYDTNAHITLIENSGSLYFSMVNNTGIQPMGAQSGLTALTEAPTSGYLSDTILVSEKHLYALKTQDTIYAKIYIESVSASAIVFNYCYQPTENITSY